MADTKPIVAPCISCTPGIKSGDPCTDLSDWRQWAIDVTDCPEPALDDDCRACLCFVPKTPPTPTECCACDVAIAMERSRPVTDKADYYNCCGNVENLTWTEPDDAIIQELLDGEEPKNWPTTVKAEAWVRKTIDDELRGRLAEAVLEACCDHMMHTEEMGDPDDGVRPTEAMIDAAQTFSQDALDKYVPWACERAPELDVEMPTHEFVREHCKHWLDEPAVLEWVRKQEEECTTDARKPPATRAGGVLG